MQHSSIGRIADFRSVKKGSIPLCCTDKKMVKSVMRNKVKILSREIRYYFN